jgi:cutinase
MSSRRIARLLGTAALTGLALLTAPTPSASAEQCSDVDVVFARGTFEPPGVGGIGQAFVDSLQSDVGGRSVAVYAVDYPASTDFPTAIDGVNDAIAHVRSVAANCPKTKIVLGGYSQGAAVIGFVTSSVVPDGVVPSTVNGPMPPAVAAHVAAVALFGKPSTQFMSAVGQPAVPIGPLYAAKTDDLCAVNDPICSDGGGDPAAHGAYVANGMVDQAAAFAAHRI